MFDVGMDDETIVDNFQEENNSPPYLIYRETDDEGYPGGSFQGSQLSMGITGPNSVTFGTGPQGMQLHDILSVNANHNYNTDTAPGLLAPCGLLCFQIKASNVGASAGALPSSLNGNINAGIWMKITLAAGEYQGVFAPDMREVN
jgi:hypothetical protein